MAEYRWENPYEWLEEKVDEWPPEKIKATMLQLALSIGSDDLQDMFQEEMDADCYFDPIS